ncbi:DUF397 domain-containing protein [Actinomadura sp. 7K507]|uniref:DUF397 domain-containing protein n=1 Tax=Actinomadura sp. 7K507 TaxID=2530365 RepID=UPI001052D59F|nr:DUF397 domain-containing protein [Actinomadura sp. 7K507]TDC74677.1 DUF397 domain-containing protein [Actinomadura sp. 7K507]
MTKQAREPQWRTSTYTEAQDCVELASLDGASVGIRDSKDPRSGYLAVSVAELNSLIDRIKADGLDL